MRRLSLVLAVLALAGWAGALAALGGRATGRTIRATTGLAAATTVAAHLVAACGAGWGRRGWVLAPNLAWVEVQEEKHRRKGACFATWGAAAAVVGWTLAWAGTTGAARGVGWSAWFAVGGNLGGQPGLLVAGFVGIAARAKLERSIAQGEL